MDMKEMCPVSWAENTFIWLFFIILKLKTIVSNLLLQVHKVYNNLHSANSYFSHYHWPDSKLSRCGFANFQTNPIKI